MAIVFDAAVDGGFGGVSPLTFAHTCTGANRILHVLTYGVADNVTGVTYNGVAMTRIAIKRDNSNNGYVSLYELVNPASGTNNVAASFTGSQTSAQAMSHTGADSVQPDSSASGATANFATELDVATTVVASNCWLVGAFGATNGGMTMETGTTKRVDEGTTNFRCLVDSNGTVATGSRSLGVNSPANALNGVVASIVPFGGGGGGGITLVQLEKGPTRGFLRGMPGRISRE